MSAVDVLRVAAACAEHGVPQREVDEALAAVAEVYAQRDALAHENELIRNGCSNLAIQITTALSLARRVSAHFGRDHELGRAAISFLEAVSGEELRIADDFVLGPNNELVLARVGGAK